MNLTLDCDSGVYAVAAKREGTGCLVIANTNDVAQALDVQVSGTLTERLLTVDGAIEQAVGAHDLLPAHSILCMTYQL